MQVSIQHERLSKGASGKEDAIVRPPTIIENARCKASGVHEIGDRSRNDAALTIIYNSYKAEYAEQPDP